MKKGFTLIELLVVITIIGLLATVGLSSYTQAQRRARDARRQSDINTLRNALEIYYADNNSYITTNDAWGSVESALDVLRPTYTKQIPSDPGGQGQPYRYRSVGGVGGNQEYCLEAFLEAPRADEEDDNNCTVLLQTNYNYGVSNP